MGGERMQKSWVLEVSGARPRLDPLSGSFAARRSSPIHDDSEQGEHLQKTGMRHQMATYLTVYNSLFPATCVRCYLTFPAVEVAYIDGNICSAVDDVH